MQNTRQKVSFSSRNNITIVNSVVYAQKWAWPRNRAHRIALLALGVEKIEPHHFVFS